MARKRKSKKKEEKPKKQANFKKETDAEPKEETRTDRITHTFIHKARFLNE